MRARERNEARLLREKGWSIREISQEIKCAKSSISGWVRDIPLTSKQIERLDDKQDKARAKAAEHPNSLKAKYKRIRQEIIDNAASEINRYPSREVLKFAGACLYWAEGSKASVNMVNFSNSDPAMIALMMKFFRKVCKVCDHKFRGMVHIHPHLDGKRAEQFWSQVSGIPLAQFHKLQYAQSKASKQKRDTLPLGTFRIVICDVALQSRIKGWIKGIARWSSFRAVGAIG
jgi:vacuolar-type H+-ATPase subunit H